MENFLTLLTAAIGKSVDSPEVQALFADQDITEKLIVDDDDYETYVERPLLGYSFNIIEQESIKNPKYNQQQPNKTLVLRACHFYSEGYENYRQYRGELPNNLSFADSREIALQKLGDSDWQYEKNNRIKRERWEFEEAGHQLNLTYSDDEQTIKIISFGIREFFTV
jgi:hypothetical protein